MRQLLPALALTLLPAAAGAQAFGSDRTVPDSVFQHAQRLVTAGAGTEGRAIVDSLLKAARPGSADYAEALYWRAALAETAAEAERGYLRLAIEYPQSPRTDAALYRLGQLELTRGNRDVALGRFRRLTEEFPESPLIASTQLAMARIYLDQRRPREGCAAVAEAKRLAPAGDVELQNRMAYLDRQCSAMGASIASAAADTPRADTAAPPRPTTRPGARPAPAPSDPAGPTEPAPREVADAAPARPTATPTAARPTASRPAGRPAPPARGAAAAPSSAGFAVQVAAFDRAAPARELADKLRADGWEARVDADAQWHRVRIGHFATRAEAAAFAKRLKDRGVTGFVTGVGGR